MSTEPGSFTSNGSMIVVSNRLPFVLKRNEVTGLLERKARSVYFFFYFSMFKLPFCFSCMFLHTRLVRDPCIALSFLVRFVVRTRCRVSRPHDERTRGCTGFAVVATRFERDPSVILPHRYYDCPRVHSFFHRDNFLRFPCIMLRLRCESPYCVIGNGSEL